MITDMKYLFNKIFPLLIKQEENAEKPHFGTNLGLLGPNLGPKIFFWMFQFYFMLHIVPNCNHVQYQAKLM